MTKPVKPQKSAFAEWFKSQFGPRPSNKPQEILRCRMLDAQDAYIAAKDKYDDTQRWDADYHVALTTHMSITKETDHG